VPNGTSLPLIERYGRALLVRGDDLELSDFGIGAVLSRFAGDCTATGPAVPQHGAHPLEIRDFIASLPLPADLRNQVMNSRQRDFAAQFRLLGIDRADEGACTRFEYLNGRDAYGMTPLMRAIKEEDFDLACNLTEHGALVDGELLTFVIRNNAPDTFIEQLCDRMKYPQFDEWDHPHFDALWRQHRLKLGDLFDSVCLLAKRSRPLVDRLFKNPTFRQACPFHDAAECGRPAVIPILKDAGFDINEMKNGDTPLMNAMTVGHSGRAVVEALLKAGASASAENVVGDSALTWARRYGHKDIALLLIRYGAPASEEIKNWISKDEDQQN
jgi:Ankyrin repeats (3 copies)